MRLFTRTKPAAANLTESVELFEFIASEAKVDRDTGIIKRVKVLGGKSQNGYEYTNDAMIGAVPLYEGVRVYINHNPKGNREFDEWVGVLKEARYESGGIYADMHLRKEAKRFGELCEAAEKFSHAFGLSHHAKGDVIRRGGRGFVERIEGVLSVDFVPRAATNQSLFESQGPTMKKKIAIIAAENKASHVEWATLLESVDGTVEVELAEGATGDEQLAEAVGVAVCGLLESADSFATAQASVAKLFKLDVPAKKTETPPPAPTGDKALLESIQSTLATLQKNDTVSRVLDSHGLTRATIGAERVKLLESQADETAMGKIIKDWPPAVRGVKPPYGQTQNLTESVKDEASIPATREGVRSVYRSR